MGVHNRPSQVKPNGVPKAKSKQDEAIIGTNDYSIVSKRSVEKLYCRDEPEFLRPFVHKFKRRAPLINRGYWLRQRVIQAVVRRFLDEKTTSKSKAVVNLGCGYAPMPFRTMWKYPDKCRNVKFVDVDFPQLIKKKLEIMKNEPVFKELFNADIGQTPSHASILYESEKYCAIGCDLGHHNEVQRVLRDRLGLDCHSVLFIGEVSIVYMPPREATDLLELTSKFSDARFCLLEQHLPAGNHHPFARTMIDHFNKQTPLRGLPAYSTIESQIARFLNAGWHDIQATDLWSLWQNVNFMSDVDRVSLDKVEPFDEWEGLALFAGHYLLLLATTAEAHASAAPWKQALMSTPVAPKLSSKPMKRVLFDATDIPKGNGRLNGAVLKVDKSSFIHCGGMVNSACQGPGDFYSLSDKRRPSTLMPHVNLSCQTITPLEDGSSLLVGGRTSPLQASSKCYLFENDQWTQVADLQPGRYRHCAVPISICGKLGVLVFGGKTGSGEVLDHWSLFLDHQWHEVAVTGDQPPGLFGAAIVATGSASGFLVGGLSKNGRFHSSAKGAGLWYWSLQEMGPESIKLNVAFTPVKDAEGSLSESLPRFGAVAVRVGPGVLLIGGVGPRGPLRHGEEIILLRNDGTVVPCEPVLSEIDALPMFVGHSIKRISDDELIMVGGGTVCFSFGAFWNSKTYSLVLGDLHKSPGKHWKLLSDLRKVMDDKHSSINVGKDSTQGTIDSRITQTSNNLKMQGALKGDPVQRISELPTVRENVHRFTARPVVIRGLNLGLCTSLWTKDYLKEKIGPSTPTIIHAASSPHLSFRDKNFVYETVAFNSFLDDAFAGSHVYMRALSTSKPSKAPANLAIDYPALAVDFKIPDELKFAEQHQHSSVLRISGDVNMWLHYDVMSNVLCQVSGSKRVILFPPKDISYLDFPAGNTTSNLDVFTADARKFANCSPMETALSAGEVLFIPACWPHATAPMPETGQDGLSVAVNVFFKSFAEKLYAAGRDVYGNRDLEMYQNGRKHVEKIRGLFNGQDPQGTAEKIMTLAQKLRARERAMEHDLGGKDVNRIIASTRDVPDDIARFYLARLADELMDCPKQP